MKISKYKLDLPDFQLLKQAIHDRYEVQYETQMQDLLITCWEQYYFRNNSTQMNMIVVRRDSGSLFVDLIGGAGGTGFFDTSLGSEGDFIRKAEELLETFAKSHGADLKWLADENS